MDATPIENDFICPECREIRENQLRRRNAKKKAYKEGFLLFFRKQERLMRVARQLFPADQVNGNEVRFLVPASKRRRIGS